MVRFTYVAKSDKGTYTVQGKYFFYTYSILCSKCNSARSNIVIESVEIPLKNIISY
jgi:hypothetical protein